MTTVLPIRQETPIKSFSISAYILRGGGEDAQVLLLRRRSRHLHDSWQQVSGLVEPGETAMAAALREIGEETGIVPDRFYSADLVECFYEVSQNCVNLVPVFVAFVDSDQQVVLSHEHGDSVWATWAEADRLLPFRQQRDAIEHIRKVFLERTPNEFLRVPGSRQGG